MTFRFKGIPTDEARHFQRGGKDAYGQVPEQLTSDGNGNPCRHCLRMIEAGEAFLVLAYRPFSALQPYAEQGPIFLHKEECAPAPQDDHLPSVLEDSPTFLVRGYNSDERIVYGTGKVVANEDIKTYAASLFANSEISFVHVRSASNNCYQAKIERSETGT